LTDETYRIVVNRDVPIHTAVILQVVHSVTGWYWTQTFSTMSTDSQWRVHVITFTHKWHYRRPL